MMNKKYADFLPGLQGAEELMVRVDEVSKEMDVLKNYIENEVCEKLLAGRAEQSFRLTAVQVLTVGLWTQVHQNLHVAVTEYAKLKQQLERNTIIIQILGHLKEVIIQYMAFFLFKYRGVTIHRNPGSIRTLVLRSRIGSFSVQCGNKMQKKNLLVVYSELL